MWRDEVPRGMYKLFERSCLKMVLEGSCCACELEQWGTEVRCRECPFCETRNNGAFCGNGGDGLWFTNGESRPAEWLRLHSKRTNIEQQIMEARHGLQG